ncbi:hypothetical protein [Paenibacillus sp. YYML68]|uniref:hypothetical protein n=1 Tax=Paenibacillus sp. YYML68 TaxID=2909250 RepID=UPI00248F8112|nr:hypothetical protein [Paenibacillus sp. YYML68]
MSWLHMNIHSEALRMPLSLEVLLPEATGTAHTSSRADTDDYRALYLLHPLGGDHTSWLRRTSIERYIDGLPVAVIMPQGLLGCNTNTVYGRDYYTFITEELPALCERVRRSLAQLNSTC